MGIVTAVTDVFTSVGTWIVSQLSALQSLFWTVATDGTVTLTFVGVLTLIGLAISISLLIINLIKNFMTLH